MKKTRIFALLLVLCLFLGQGPVPVLAAPETETAETTAPGQIDPGVFRQNQLVDAPPYEAGCETALLLELNSGIVVYAKNAEGVVYPASLTKIMTCLLALQYAGNKLDTIVEVSETALAGIAEAGGEVRLQVGEELPLRDVLYYLMVLSSNEAANVVAEFIAGDIDSFVNLMNRTAQELGCTNTHFANTHGLHDPNHYTTARDLSIITRKALTNETFREICYTASYIVAPTNKSSSKEIVSTNYLILKNSNLRYLADNGNYYPYYYDLAKGIKTGYTSAAGRCVISRATDGNMDLLCIIMGAQTRVMSDNSPRYDNFVEAKKLFNYGFDNFAYAKVVAAKLSPMYQIPVEYAKDKRGVVLIPSTDVSCLLPNDYDKDKVTMDYTLNETKGLKAPLEQGEKVGVLSVYYNGTKMGETTLETLTAVQSDTASRAIDDTVNFLTGADKPEEERTLLQKILSYWYVPFLLIGVLFLLLVIRYLYYRHRRRVAIRRRKERAARRARLEGRE